jgi:hypothetical protein
MKIKYLYIVFVSLLLIGSISQLFTIPPYAGNVFPVYKSGYFNELDRQFNVIIDSFLNIKMMSKSAYAWIFLKDIQKKHNINIKVYNNKGFEIPAPGETRIVDNDKVIKLLNSIDPKIYSYVDGGKYFSVIPVFREDRCKFCHSDTNKKNIAGVITFDREYDAYIYYSSERIIIFSVISLVLLILLYYIIRWDPGRNVKELFDKIK